MAVSAKQREQVAIALRRLGKPDDGGELVISLQQLMAWGPSGRKIGSEVRRRLKDAGYDERWHTLDYWVDAKRLQYHYTWRLKKSAGGVPKGDACTFMAIDGVQVLP